MKRAFFAIPGLLFFIISLFNFPAHATMTAQITPSKATMDDTLRLTLTLDNTNTQKTPDLSALRIDFNIVGTQRSLSYSFINGQSLSRAQWIIILSPKKTGTFTIPAIQLGSDKTQPLSVEITQTAVSSSNTAPEYELLTSVDNPKAYIHQQIIYTVRLSRSTQFIDSNYQPPQVEDALLVPLNDASATNEQRYAIFPQKRGHLVIHPPQLSAMIYDTMPHRIFMQGKEITLDIQPQPKDVHTWLPAKQVKLTESYTQTHTPIIEGDTITRKVTLKAIGIPNESLPTLFFQSSPQLTAYPEKPSSENTVENNNVVGTQIYTISYLIHGSGEINLPEISIHWFNTQTGKPETTMLPAHKIIVQAKLSTPHSTHKTPILQTPTSQSNKISIAWWLSGGFALLWLITLLLFWKHIQNKPKTPKPKYDLPTLIPKPRPK